MSGLPEELIRKVAEYSTPSCVNRIVYNSSSGFECTVIKLNINMNFVIDEIIRCAKNKLDTTNDMSRATSLLYCLSFSIYRVNLHEIHRLHGNRIFNGNIMDFSEFIRSNGGTFDIEYLNTELVRVGIPYEFHSATYSS